MGKLILVTGAGRGLGYAVAQLHLEAGDEVYALEYDPTDELRALETTYKDRLHTRQCDIGNTASVNKATAELVSRGQKLDILYNVAALYSEADRVGLAETDLDGGLRMYDVNGVGLLRVCKAVFSLIGEGTLVANITSEAGSITNCYRSCEYIYCISKAAANMASKLLCNEIYPLGGRVVCFHPGWLRTCMGGKRAAASEHSITALASARGIVGITTRIEEIPPSWLFMQHDSTLLPW